MPQTLRLNNEKWKKSLFYEEKSLVGLTPGYVNLNPWRVCLTAIIWSSDEYFREEFDRERRQILSDHETEMKKQEEIFTEEKTRMKEQVSTFT
jgi:hypothetical protein